MLRTSLGLKHIENPVELRKELELVTKAGFDTVDLDLSMSGQIELLHDARALERAKEARAILDEYGMKVYQGHSPYNMHRMDDPEFDRTRLEEVKISLDVASVLGVEYMIVHPYFCSFLIDPQFLLKHETMERNIAMYSRYVAQGKEIGVKICTENMFSVNNTRSEVYRNFFSTADGLIELIDAVPGLSCCFDTGHAMITGNDLPDMVRKLGGRITTLHLHNNNRNYDLHLTPFQHFATDWQSFCKALKEVGYQGSMNLEVGAFVAVCPQEMKQPSYQYLYATARTLASMVEKA